MMRMNLKKILPIETPPIRGYQFFAYPLSVISTNKNYLPWLCNHYIQLFCNPQEVKVHFYEPYNRYTNNPWFDYEVISKASIKSFNMNPTNLIIEYINRGYYIVSLVDEYYIPKRRAYKKLHMKHDIFIFGYDISNKNFDILGYDENVIFNHTYVPFKCFEKSFFKLDSTSLIAFKLNTTYNCELDIVSIVSQLNDYLNSNNSSNKLKPYDDTQNFSDHVFGLDTYNQVIHYFELLLNKEVEYDLISLHFMYEHKKCMLLRLQLLAEKGYINDINYYLKTYDEIKRKIKIARNLQLKYKITKNNNSLKKIISLLKEIYPKEKNIVENILNELQTK